MDQPNHLWSGGLWEQENPDYPLPPPVVIPEPVAFVPCELPPKKNRLSRRAKFAFGGMLCMILGIASVSALQELKPFESNFTLPGIFGFDAESIPREFGGVKSEPTTNEPPTIRSAPLGSGVTLEFSDLQLFPKSPQDIYQDNLESIVLITAKGKNSTATATGVIMSQDGYIITNAHVIEDSSSATVTLWNNEKYNAELVGYDFPQDLAVLKISAYHLQPAEFADSDLLSVGESCYAMGNPLGTEYRATFTNGIISAIDRVLEVNELPMVLVQTSAAINTGNSGGALLNPYGQVIGITTIKLMSDEDTIEGMGFAIPSKRVKQVVDRLIEGEEVVPTSIGISVYEISTPVLGVKVEFVNRDSNAYEAGMRDGDIIIQANGRTVETVVDIDLVKGYLFPGEMVDYVVYRNGKEVSFSSALEAITEKS